MPSASLRWPAPWCCAGLGEGTAGASAAAQRAYAAPLLHRLLPWRRRVAALLLAGLVVTVNGLWVIPTVFIPDEDLGQLRGYFTLADGSSLQQPRR